MRIGLVCPYSLDVPGGVQNHVLGLAETLLDGGHDVTVLAPSQDPTRLAPYVVSAGRSVPVPYKGTVGRVSLGPFVAARVSRWLRESDLDVLHVHEPVTPSVSLLALGLSDVPVVATFHTAQRGSRVLAASANVGRSWLGKIDAHVAVSEVAARTVRSYLPVDPVVIPNGLHVDRFSGPRSERVGEVLFLGRVDERRKGLPQLLAAWPSVLARHPEARLVVAGPGRVSATLPPRVELLGEVDEAGRLAALKRAELLVAPNTHGESFGIVLAEAMAAGTAIVATDLPAFSDLLLDGRAGTLASSAELAEAIATLLADQQRRHRTAHLAKLRVLDFDWPRVAEALEPVYEAASGGVAAAG